MKIGWFLETKILYLSRLRAALLPETDKLVPIVSSCEITLGDVYDNRLAVIFADGEGPVCYDAPIDPYLAIVYVPTL